jgi:hypothetical protein
MCPAYVQFVFMHGPLNTPVHRCTLPLLNTVAVQAKGTPLGADIMENV